MEATPENWSAVDDYLAEVLIGPDAALDAALAAQEQAGLPAIEVAPVAGKLLYLLAQLGGVKRVLEIGTLGGYSTIWMARAVGEGGRVTTIEAEPWIAEIARNSIDAAGIGERVEILIGRAAEVLPGLSDSYDMIFIDADKESNTLYLDQAARLGRPGTLIVLDNIGRSGDIVDADTEDSMVIGTQQALRMLGDDPRFDATALQTVGVKGWDGLAIALLR